MELQKTKYKIAILDNGEIESLNRLKNQGISVEMLMDSYDYILIPEWVWQEVCDSEFRKTFIEEVQEKGYPVHVISEKKYNKIVSAELTLIEVFGKVIHPYAQLVRKYKKDILKGQAASEIEYLYEEWIEKIYSDWPSDGDIITRKSGEQRQRKKNAGEISIVFLAILLMIQENQDVEITIWSRDADCRFYMDEAMQRLQKDKRLSSRVSGTISYKPLEVVIQQIRNSEMLDDIKLDDMIDDIRIERNIKYLLKKDDNSCDVRIEMVTNEKFKELIKDKNMMLIW